MAAALRDAQRTCRACGGVRCRRGARTAPDGCRGVATDHARRGARCQLRAFTASASHNPGALGRAFDGDRTTRWFTGERQQGARVDRAAVRGTRSTSRACGSRWTGAATATTRGGSSSRVQTMASAWRTLFEGGILPRLGAQHRPRAAHARPSTSCRRRTPRACCGCAPRARHACGTGRCTSSGCGGGELAHLRGPRGPPETPDPCEAGLRESHLMAGPTTTAMAASRRSGAGLALRPAPARRPGWSRRAR